MNKAQKILRIMSVVFTMFGCSSSSNNDRVAAPPPPITQQDPKEFALSLTDFSWKSYQEVPWEANCEGIGQFFQDFAVRYLPGVQFVKTPKSCDSFADISGNFVYIYQFHYQKGDARVALEAEVKQIKNETKAKLSRVTDKEISLYRFSAADNEVGNNLIHLSRTLGQWMAPLEQEKTFHGRPYSQFLQEFTERYQAEPGEIIKTEPLMKVRITPSSGQKNSGKLEFLELADAYFQSGSAQTADDEQSFFGCRELECIQGKRFTYLVSGTRFIIFPEDFETMNGILVGRYWYVDIKSWPLLKE